MLTCGTPPQEEEDFSDDADEDEAALEASKQERRPPIYNMDAIHDKLEDIGWTMEVDWSEHQSITSAEPTKVENVDDDLERELSFYNQALAAAQQAIKKFETSDAQWLRPPDYYAGQPRSLLALHMVALVSMHALITRNTAGSCLNLHAHAHIICRVLPDHHIFHTQSIKAPRSHGTQHSRLSYASAHVPICSGDVPIRSAEHTYPPTHSPTHTPTFPPCPPEMVKSDVHMNKVKEQLMYEQKQIEEMEERKKQREQKYFAKKMQVRRQAGCWCMCWSGGCWCALVRGLVQLLPVWLLVCASVVAALEFSGTVAPQVGWAVQASARCRCCAG